MFATLLTKVDMSTCGGCACMDGGNKKFCKRGKIESNMRHHVPPLSREFMLY
ncbi:hypothetical protein MtrunA17_Chr5g0400911 [Medicago truncatula]|uniref:Uncharacterized protein n=1 Tax=Medicago truncatula TaxID=3880 RepID=A0A396HKN2_MEDTR|nr:hypothetical protein MtrunA17_Chr5g0400911 [Medicago truncatula]